MKKNKFINAVEAYVEKEVVSKTEGIGKWTLWMLVKGLDIHELLDSLLESMPWYECDGEVDEEIILSDLKESAEKYGPVSVYIPMAGYMEFTVSDVEKLTSFVSSYRLVS